MNVTVREWIQTGREKYHTGKLSDQDFDRLAQLIETKKQINQHAITHCRLGLVRSG